MVRWIGRLAVIALMLGAVVSSAQARSVAKIPRHKLGPGTSTNWSGYAIDGTGATAVTGTWVEPKVTCAPGENSWSSPWVGIDGDNSNTVEQIGTDSDCRNGVPSYYAWYEMYPKGMVVLNMGPVSPGDSFTGSVAYSSQPGGFTGFTLTLTDTTTHVTKSVQQSSTKAPRTSVEWIMEGPSKGLLSDFGSPFGFTGSSATISGKTGGLSSFTTAQPITMVSSTGTVRAQPSTVSSSAFGVTWKHA
jgi:hypothetical protein